MNFIKKMLGYHTPPKEKAPEPEVNREWIYIGDGMVEEVVTTREKVKVNDQIYTGRVTRSVSGNVQRTSSTSSHTQTTQPYVYTDVSPSYDSSPSCDSGYSGGSCD